MNVKDHLKTRSRAINNSKERRIVHTAFEL